MSQENVEVIKTAIAALNRGDLDSAWDSFAADAELQDLLAGPDQATVVRGTAAIREVWGLWMGAFDDLRADVEQYIDAGDTVICATHWVGHGRTSGISVDIHQFDAYELRDGKIIRATFGYKSKDEAVEAVGLAEQAMSQENVEFLRRGYDAFNRQDFEAWLDLLDPEVEFQESALTPDARTYYGGAGAREWLRSGQEAFVDVSFQVERVIAEGDAIAAIVVVQGRGTGRGAEFKTRIAHASRWRNGKAVFVAAYPDLREALEAVGLSEQDARADS